jgi:ABC-type cobalamin/Fe3+-siderophores transport system ATPase subunit
MQDERVVSEDADHVRAESALAEARARHLRERPVQQLSDAERNDLVLADFWARRLNAKPNPTHRSA